MKEKVIIDQKDDKEEKDELLRRYKSGMP